jgi:hypothetical protein
MIHQPQLLIGVERERGAGERAPIAGNGGKTKNSARGPEGKAIVPPRILDVCPAPGERVAFGRRDFPFRDHLCLLGAFCRECPRR